MSVDPRAIHIDLSRDALIDAFGHTTLQERYLVPGETSPQHAFARASAAFADDIHHAQRLYDYVSQHWFMFATPLLSNGGTERGLPISCFLTDIGDSREDISAHYDEVIWLSSTGGGIGSYYGGLREKDSKTSKGSASTGIIPFLAVDDRLILAVSQGGTRRGSHAVYVDVHHPEIREFVTIRKPTGDANRKATNLHHGVNITDEFMARVKDGEPFPLRSPKDNAIVAWEDARELWKLMLETRKQTGEPYFFQIDEANRKLPEAQKKLGLKIKHSNLCVTGDTELLTETGYLPIEALVDQKVKVWNGSAYSEVEVVKTSDEAEIIRVWFEDGHYIDCTPYHKFYDEEGDEIRAIDLDPGTILESPELEPIHRPSETPLTGADYIAGWGTFAGFEDDHMLAIYAEETVGDGALKNLFKLSTDILTDSDSEGKPSGHKIRYERQTIKAGFVPVAQSTDARLAWLGGALDAAADWIDVDGEPYLCLGTVDRSLIADMRLMSLELGMRPTVRYTDLLSAYMLHASDYVAHLEGVHSVRHKSPTKFEANPALTVTVADVHLMPGTAATYCFTEPLRNRGVFNGYLTGNCTEITLATGRDQHGKKRTAVCCLSSVNAEHFPAWSQHPLFIEDLMRMLDNVLTYFIDKAPEGLRHAAYSAMMERSVGLGVLGVHSFFQKNMIPFESHRARLANLALFKHVSQKADEASFRLGIERGEAPDMMGTGHRFAHRMALAPNASSSILCGNTSPSAEPWCANVYLQKTLSGSYAQKNPNLVRALASIDLDIEPVWKAIIAAEGSIQTLDQSVEGEPSVLEEQGFTDWDTWATFKDTFKTAHEIKQRTIIQLAVDRQPWIGQAQSINLFYPADSDPDEISHDHYVAMTSGLKSLYYLRSTAARRGENVNTKVKRTHVDVQEVDIDLGALVSNAMVRPDSDCVSCEG